ncbi:RNF166 [Mytilus coruscus]|uniref:RNF166 n=1 Tax=Mytilus coruscus TaxID=42192 RepID=A0A6J8CYI9_MYTCO|nr:RNF166 [Mytilus coruscus]
MEADNFVCNLCCYATSHFEEFSKHFVRKHKNDPNDIVSCATDACEFTTRRWNIFKVHLHRKHKIDYLCPQQNVQQHEPMNVDELNECVSFDKQDDLTHHNALYTMALEANYNISRTAIDHVISSTCTLLDAQLDYSKRQQKEALELRNIDPDVVDSINVSHI